MRYFSVVVVGLTAGMLATFGGCNAANRTGARATDGGRGIDTGKDGEVQFEETDGSGPRACKNLECQRVQCKDDKTTSVTGTVYAPNGTLPLYNVIVYVPNGTPDDLPAGATCDRCGAMASGEPIASALTDAKGRFRLENVPAGENIPLVIQLGKWRRQIVIPEVTACEDTKLTDPDETRLPRNRTEGDMPRIAVTTGAADQIACMLPKLGIDRTEFGPGASAKSFAVELYNGAQLSGYPGQGPPGTRDASALWNDVDKLKQYDMLVISCEGYEASTQATGGADFPSWPKTQSPASYAAMTQYLAEGGRIFTTDYEYTWYKFSPDPKLRAAMTIPGGAPAGDKPMSIDLSFSKGKALADWLKYVEPSATYGKLATDHVFANISASSSTAQVWTRSGVAAEPRFITINTPVGKPATEQCGKAVHLDAHINTSDKVVTTFPADCTTPLKEGEKAFAFFFFDLAACIQKEDDVPPPPPVIK